MVRNGCKILGMVALVMAVITGSAFTAFAVNHSGTISVDETWKKADNPHIITGDVYVQNSVVRPTLTIEPGCNVLFNAGTSLHIGWSSHGKLIAKGTASQKITFTSNLASKTAGDWDEIDFWVDPSGSWMKHCIVEYGGGGTRNASIYLGTGAAVTNVKIDNCMIRKSQTYGVNVADSAKRLSSFRWNKINNCGLHPVNIFGDYVSCLGVGNSYSGNNPNCIRVNSDTVTTTQTWLDQGVPYCMTGNLWVQHSANSPVLTMAPGVTLLMPQGSDIQVGRSWAGALMAVGTAAKPVTFTSIVQPGYHGDWLGVRFYDNSIDAQNKLINCVVEHGGGNGYGNIYLSNCSVEITNSKCRKSSSDGIYFDNGGFPTNFTGNTIEDSWDHALYLYGEYLRALSTGNTYLNNEINEVQVIGDEVVTTGTWPAGIPLHLTGDLHIRLNGGNPVITIAPGAIIKADPNTRITVGASWPGGLIAKGDPCNTILFTAWRTDTTGGALDSDNDISIDSSIPGDWKGIEFYSQTTLGSEVTNCTLEYGGSSGSGIIYINSTNSVRIDRNTIRHSLSNGIYVTTASPEITKNLITNNRFNGIFTTGAGTSPKIYNNHIMYNNNGVWAQTNAFPLVGGSKKNANTFEGNRIFGVENTSAAISLDAKNNWWGNVSGPSGQGPGSGDAVGTFVDFSNFRKKPMAWVCIDKFWTVNPNNEKPKNKFKAGNPIGYRVRYSMRNGSENAKTMVTPLGKSFILLTDGTNVTHTLPKSRKLKKLSGFCYEADFDWNGVIPNSAVTKKIYPWIKLAVPERFDKVKGQFEIVP